MDGPYTEKNPKAFNFIKEWKSNVEIVHAYLEKAFKRTKKWANTHRRQLQFQAGDLVMIKLLLEQIQSLHTRDTRLIRRYKGPLPIVAKIEKASYTIITPSWMKVYPAFHVSNLKSYHPDVEDEEHKQPTKVDTKL